MVRSTVVRTGHLDAFALPEYEGHFDAVFVPDVPAPEDGSGPLVLGSGDRLTIRGDDGRVE